MEDIIMSNTYEFKTIPDFIPRGVSILRKNVSSLCDTWHRVGRVSDTGVVTFYQISDSTEQEEIRNFLQQEGLLE